MTPPRSRWVRRAWRLLTRPHPAIVEQYDRDRVRLVAGVLAFLVPGVVLIVVAAVATGVIAGPDAGAADPNLGIVLLVIVGLVAAYALSRSPWPGAGSLVAVGALYTAIWTTWATGAGSRESLDALYLTVVPVLLASVTFRVWATAALAFGNLVLLSFVLTWNDAAADPPDPGSELVLIALAFLSTLVAVVSSMMLDGDRRRIIKANHDLEESKRTQMQMLNNVAHDLASPLTPIRIQMYLLARGASQDQVQTAVGIVQRNVDHLDRLVHDLKDMAKAEAGMLRIHPHAVDLETVVKTAVASLVAQASLKSVTLDVVTDGPLPLKADAQRLTQVLYNLIGNAVKFTPPEGRVVVRAGRHRGSARVDVVDTGRGLTAEEAAQLFRPFVQVHDPSEVKDKGTGLGLFISKQLVEAHGGRIWVESPGRGQGATFAFELPMSGVEPTRTA